MQKIVLVDGHSIINRAYYGVPALTNSAGFPTNGIYGFFGILTKILEEERPTHLAVAFDLPKPTFRHRFYDGYKGTRKPMPEDLHKQVPVLKELLQSMQIPVLTAEGYEADDILGTVSRVCEEAGMMVTVLSGDRDLLQLASDRVCICLPKTKGKVQVTEYYHADDVAAAYGVTPEEYISVKALMGDASDNIPGVAGIGEKTAVSLIGQYHDLDALYRELDSIPQARVRNALTAHEDDARMSYYLAEICRTVPLAFSVEEAAFSSLYTEEAYAMLSELEIHSILRRFPEDIKRAYAEKKKAAKAGKTVIGLTGGVGCGKSTVIRVLEKEFGADIIMADRVAEELMQPGQEVFCRIAASFGDSILKADGTLDRAALSDRIFSDRECRKTVNAIVHDATEKEIERRIEKSGKPLIVYECALPKEGRFDRLCTAVWYVYASEQTRMERLFFGRGYSFEKTRSIMDNQMSEKEFRALADTVIDNDGPEEKTAEAVRTAAAALLSGKAEEWL